ncbi:MAG TPA: efflux RND transporter periplasmic adaptor subunit [Gemmatimonadales bacterium]|jgi:multidrug efflux system membrane fusion protein|nr:efflux RND transporter periplasmic adaptor subunit [Gemmatimonadales bacterium]
MRLTTSSRWFAWSAGLAGALALACAKAPQSAAPAPAVTVAVVPTRDITEWDEVSGRFEAVDAVDIRPRVSGYLRRVAFAEGKEVRKGEVLFEIDPRPYQAELSRAEAALDQAKSGAALAARDVERARRLVDVKAISQEEFDGRVSASAQGSASVRGAEALVATARLNLEWTQVRAPISGRVGRAEVTEGNLVQAGPPSATLLTTVVSLDPIYVSFETDEATYLKYSALARAGTRPSSRDGKSPISLGLSNEDGAFPHTGYVDFVDNQLNPATGTIRTRAVFSNKDRLFTPGLFARLKLAGSGRHPATLVLDRAIGTDQDKKFVLVVKPDSTVDYRPVQIGRLIDGFRVVVSGLEPGEQIVINGLQRVRPGMKTTPTVVAMRADSGSVTARR